MVIFDDVLMPWERVYIHRDAELRDGLYKRTGIMPQIMYQFSTKNLAKSEFMMGLAFAIAKTTNIDQHLHVQCMLAELIQDTEFCRACLRGERGRCGAEPVLRHNPGGDAAVDGAHDVPEDVRADVRDHPVFGAGGLVVVPSYAELDGPVASDVTTYFQAANIDAKTHIKLFRLAFDATVSPFAGRQQLYERYYSGDPARLAGTLYGLYDKETHIERIFGLLDDLEAQENAGGSESSLDRPPLTG
jgi:4-hydroxyphenylacetate 3-monooxygenase